MVTETKLAYIRPNSVYSKNGIILLKVHTLHLTSTCTTCTKAPTAAAVSTADDITELCTQHFPHLDDPSSFTYKWHK